MGRIVFGILPRLFKAERFIVATTDAPSAVCEAIAHLLESAMISEQQIGGSSWQNLDIRFNVYQPDDFASTTSTRRITSGASVFLYRALPNLFHRNPSGDCLPDGRRQYSKLPLDLHLLITIWGDTPQSQNRLLGWVMRTLEDYRVIPASVLNVGSNTPVFDPDESVELFLSEMGYEELLQVWDMLGTGDLHYQITIPYLVRNLMIKSRLVIPVGEPVQVRTMDLQRLEVG